MEKPDDSWNVLPHGPLEQLSDNLHWCLGSVPKMSLKRAMTVVKKRDGSLVIHSAIALDEHTQQQLEALGRPTFLLVPNQGHRLDAPAYKKRYPALRVFAPKGGIDKVRQVVPVDGGYEDFPSDDEVRLEPLHGIANTEGAMLVRSRDGLTVVLNDVVMNMDRKRDVLGFLFTTVMGSAPGPRVSRLAKLVFVKDKAALRQDLERFAALPDLTRLIVSHENVAMGTAAAEALRRAATYL